ncbi:hypothetical protein shim_34560 [Shimia sp. SK013]|nr:hypothetical protein shim_34560 [Shimia sp. SK013]
MTAMRVAPDLVGALDCFGIGDLVQGAQVLVCVIDGANAPSGGRSGAARLKSGRKKTGSLGDQHGAFIL